MSIATAIQRLQGIKSEIMAALERKNVDTTGKNISDVGDLIRSIVGQTVRIGEHDYGVVKIGNLLWTTENLRELIGVIGSTQFWAEKGNDPDDIRGALYKKAAIFRDRTTYTTNFQSLLHDGWRLPSYNDFFNMMRSLGVENPVLESNFRFERQPEFVDTIVGIINWQNSYEGKGQRTDFWVSEYDYHYWASAKTTVFFQKNPLADFSFSIRLCKDA